MIIDKYIYNDNKKIYISYMYVFNPWKIFCNLIALGSGVRFSLDPQFIRPCATSKQRAL